MTGALSSISRRKKLGEPADSPENARKNRLWRLAEDAVITPVEDFPEELVSRMAPNGELPPGHYGIERRKVRSFPKIVNQDVVDVLNRFGQDGATYENVLKHFMELKNLGRDELHPKLEKMVRAFIHSNILVEKDSQQSFSAASVEPSFNDGDRWLSYRIVENVHCIVDSEIYKVEEVSTGTTRALKIMQKQFPNKEMEAKIAERLRREFDLIKCLDHPNVVKCREEGEHQSRIYGILDWVDGPSVRSYAHKSDLPVDDKQLMTLAIECLSALGAVHRYGYLHGDVHTRNFLVKDDHVCLIDFGLSRPIEISEEEAVHYAEGGVVWYMPPEYARRVIESKKGLWGSVAGEIYSSAVMLFALFSKRYPYKTTFYRKDYMKSILNDPPMSFADCGRSSWPELEKVLGRAMSKNPEERFASVAEFLTALKQVPCGDS